ASLNPFLTAHPTGSLPPTVKPAMRDQGLLDRTREVLAHRTGVSDNARRQFPRDALSNPMEKSAFVAVQGFGRFGPLGPPRPVFWKAQPRYDWALDAGAIVWLPIVALGMLLAARSGLSQYREGRPPTAWALLTMSCIALLTVTAFVPLAWDR